MSRRDIRAGRAYVELLLKDGALIKGLRNAGQRLKSFGTGMASVGGIATAAGAAIVAPFAAAVRQFNSTGDALDKMRQRTGLSVESLSELAHAAEQSGASLEDVEAGVRKMQKNLTEARTGSKTAAEAFDQLGLSVGRLAAMAPEEQFTAVAQAIAAVKDPTLRAGLAMDVLGKSGTKLLPMIEDLAKLREEARELGFTMSGEDAAAAVKFGDALANLWKTVKFGAISIGSALVPALQEMVEIIQPIFTATLKWVKENRALVTTIAAVGAGLVAAGAAVTGLGLGIALAGTALSGIASLLGVVLSPLGLITAALAGGIYYWARYTAAGQAAVSGVMGVLKTLLAAVKQTFGGISDALAGGDLAMAGQIAMAGLKLALLQGVSALSSAVGGKFGDFLGTIGAQIAGGDFTGAWETAVLGMATIWDKFVGGIVSTFGTAMHVVVNAWEATTKRLAQWILKDAAEGGVFGKAALAGTGVNMSQEQARAELIRQQRMDMKNRQLAEARGNLAKAEASGGSFADENGTVFRVDELKTFIADLEDQLLSLGMNREDVLADAQGFATAQLDKSADDIRTWIDQAPDRARRNDEELKNRTAGGAQAAEDGVAAAQAHLDRLTAQEAELRRQRDEQRAREKGEIPEVGIAGLKREVFGSFSAAALAAQGGGVNPIDRVAKAVEEHTRQNEELLKIDRALLQEARAGGLVVA